MTWFRKLADGEFGRLVSQNNHLVWSWMSVSFMDQRWGRWGNKVERPFNSHKYLLGRGMCQFHFLTAIYFTGHVKWSIFCHINEQGCHSYLWFWPSKHDFLSQADKRCCSLRKKLKDVTVIHRWAGSGFSPWAKQKHFSWGSCTDG